MESSKIFQEIPFLRILLPFIIGIIFYLSIASPPNLFIYVPGFFFISFVLWRMMNKNTTEKLKQFYGWSVQLFFLSCGFQLAYQQEHSLEKYHYRNAVNLPQEFKAVIRDIPVKGEKATKVEIEIREIVMKGKWQPANGKLLTYIHEAKEKPIFYGDELWIKTQLQLPETPKNPGGFDYADYLKRKQIFHTCFVEEQNYSRIKNTGVNFVLDIAMKIKIHLLELLQKNGLVGQELAIASSLLLGYDEEVSNELTEAYAATGTVHVLSVSGLHIGIVYLMLNFLLGFISNTLKGRLLKGFVILSSVWMFALISGLSPAAVRASVMFSLLIIGGTFRLQSHPINTILASAFLMLAWNPLLLQDIGFQLSYLALGGILLFQPFIQNWFQFKNKFANKIWILSSVSIAAQLTTFPITLYYFHQFTLSFLFANLLIIPLSTLIMYGAMFLLAISPFDLLSSFCATLLRLLIKFMNDCATFMSKIPGTVFNHWHITFSELTLIYISLVFVVFYFLLKSSRFLWLTLFSISLFMTETLLTYSINNSRKELIVYHLKKESCVDIFYGHKLFRLGNPNKDVLNNEIIHESHKYESKEIKSDQIMRINDFSITLVEEPQVYSEKKIVDVLILRKNAKVNLVELSNFFPGAIVIADGSNSYSKTFRWKKTADSLHLNFWNTYEKGAFRLIK